MNIEKAKEAFDSIKPYYFITFDEMCSLLPETEISSFYFARNDYQNVEWELVALSKSYLSRIEFKKPKINIQSYKLNISEIIKSYSFLNKYGNKEISVVEYSLRNAGSNELIPIKIPKGFDSDEEQILYKEFIDDLLKRA